MNITHGVDSFPGSIIKASEGIRSGNLLSKNNRGRDMVIINPYGNGNGDHILAKKVANIALEQGCRVTISPLSNMLRSQSDPYQNYALQYDEPHTIDQLINPLFIVLPLSVINIKKLEKHVDELCTKFNFPRNDAILIEEMDILPFPGKDIKHYAEMLRRIGFTQISENKLGFDEGAIGYIPTDDRALNEIRERFKNELHLLLDSYNVSLSTGSSYHLGYISSECFYTGAQAFITNTLCETLDDERPANFIINLRQVQSNAMGSVIESIKSILLLGKEHTGVDYLALFSKVKITAIDDKHGKVCCHNEISGQGNKIVSIVLVRSMPKNIYDDFLLLADSGMVSGDQSLSEYLSLKEKLPYYDMQPWKYTLVESIKKLYGDSLGNYIDQRVVGRDPYSWDVRSSFISSVEQPLLSDKQLARKNEADKIIATKKADTYIGELIKSHF